MKTKILLESKFNIEQEIGIETDLISIHRCNIDNMFDNWVIVLDKYAQILQQMHEGRWVFVNTIFSFLRKLENNWHWLYYKQLHTKLVCRIREYLKRNNFKIYLYDCKPEIQEYLDIQCFDYELFDTRGNLVRSIINNISIQDTLF